MDLKTTQIVLQIFICFAVFLLDVGATLYSTSTTIAPEPIDECPEITITKGSVEYIPNREIGGSINITCDVGFRLSGNEQIVCQPDSTWSDSIPICEEITCPLQEIKHGVVTGDNYYGGSITYGCVPGYALVCGDHVRSCGLDGTWTGTTPYCIWRGKSIEPVRDFRGTVHERFCAKLRERDGDFSQRPYQN